MDAKLKKTYKFNRAILFSGHEYVQDEWRPVPAGFEDQALQDDRVETRGKKSVKEDLPQSINAVDPETLKRPGQEDLSAETETADEAKGKKGFGARGRKMKEDKTETESEA